MRRWNLLKHSDKTQAQDLIEPISSLAELLKHRVSPFLRFNFPMFPVITTAVRPGTEHWDHSAATFCPSAVILPSIFFGVGICEASQPPPRALIN